MSKASPHVITRPKRSTHFAPNSNAGVSIVTSSGTQISAGFSPVASFQAVFAKPQVADEMSPNPNALVPRPPVVHFFVCDHGNAKVKAFTDQFIELLTENGIRVFPELYLTHQPGYQVRAASFDTSADFFFQIHSKTAGPGQVRLYEDGQPRRMTIQEAVLYIWTIWRLKCGALSKAEAESLSSERISLLLKEFADINGEDMKIESIQSELRNSISNGSSVRGCIEKLESVSRILDAGKMKLLESRLINSDWKREPGTVLSRCLPVPTISGLSAPLKQLLVSIVEQTQKKVGVLMNIANNHSTSEPEEKLVDEEEDLREVEIPVDRQPTTSNWSLVLESVDDHQHSLSSFNELIGSQGFMALAPNFILEDY
jgi:hypothetical protein